MTHLDLWAGGAALVACAALGMRAVMLKPQATSWASAPAIVVLALTLLSVVMLAIGVGILRGAHASPREALAYSALAVVGLVMLWNLNRQGGAGQRWSFGPGPLPAAPVYDQLGRWRSWRGQ